MSPRSPRTPDYYKLPSVIFSMSWTLIRTILASNVSIKKKTGGVQSPNVLGRAFPKSREGRELWKDWDREQGDREVKANFT